MTDDNRTPDAVPARGGELRHSSRGGELRHSSRGGELRRDALTGEWVAIVARRQTRPNLPAEGCPFCVGGLEAPEPYTVRAFENRWPAFVSAPEGVDALTPASRDAPGFASDGPIPAVGAAEVVLYSPVHDTSLGSLDVDGVHRVVDLWAQRTEALLARPDVRYVLVFENRGAEIGATIPHPHGQIYAFDFVPPVPRREAALAEAHGCPVCQEIARERRDTERIVYRAADGWNAWVPYASAYPYGLTVAPDAHVPGLPELGDDARAGLAAGLQDVLARYDRLFDRPMPYMMWIHPGVHLHVHLAPPWRAAGVARYVAAGEVGSGTYSNPVAPEDAAQALRRA